MNASPLMVSLNNAIEQVLIQLEIREDVKDLETLGLVPEEIEGYLEFFWENWYPTGRKEGRE